MTVAGLDPGTELSALVVWDGTQVLLHLTDSNDNLVKRIYNDESYSIARHLVIERVESFGMAVGRDVFETVFWSGRFAQAWDDVRNTSWHRLGRRDIKLHICGHARATDSNIRQALIDRIGPIGTKKQPGPLYGLKGHEFSALAVAVTYWDQNNGK